MNAQTGQIVLTKPVEQTTTPLGKYQVLDFSEVREPGTYAIKAGDTLTRSFRIGDDAWRDSIWKAINFMYSERCGTEIPGIHGICHQDIYTTHDDKRIVVNGGYHDAGDLSATGNTPGMVYALLSLADSSEAARRRSGSLQSSAGGGALGLELGAQNAIWRRVSQHRPIGQLLDRRDHGHGRRSLRQSRQ